MAVVIKYGDSFSKVPSFIIRQTYLIMMEGNILQTLTEIWRREDAYVTRAFSLPLHPQPVIYGLLRRGANKGCVKGEAVYLALIKG